MNTKQKRKKQKTPKRSVAAGSRRRREKYLASLKTSIEKLRVRPQDVPLKVLYELPTVFIDDGIPTSRTKRQADSLFQKHIRPTLKKGARKVEQKIQHTRQILHAAKKAMHNDSTIAYPRSRNRPDFSDIRLQIIERFIDKGLFWERRSKKGSPKMSRLVPTLKFRKFEDRDPFVFDPQMPERFVELYERGEEKIPILFVLDTFPPAILHERPMTSLH